MRFIYLISRNKFCLRTADCVAKVFSILKHDLRDDLMKELFVGYHGTSVLLSYFKPTCKVYILYFILTCKLCFLHYHCYIIHESITAELMLKVIAGLAL